MNALIDPRREVESVDDPRVVLEILQQVDPGSIGVQRERLFGRIEVDEPPSPRLIREAAPLTT
jgi:hypothetical protein